MKIQALKVLYLVKYISITLYIFSNRFKVTVMKPMIMSPLPPYHRTLKFFPVITQKSLKMMTMAMAMTMTTMMMMMMIMMTAVPTTTMMMMTVPTTTTKMMMTMSTILLTITTRLVTVVVTMKISTSQSSLSSVTIYQIWWTIYQIWIVRRKRR